MFDSRYSYMYLVVCINIRVYIYMYIWNKSPRDVFSVKGVYNNINFFYVYRTKHGGDLAR
jgi:hypothetical protein